MADKETGDACPVDHKTRDAWLQQARASEAAKASSASPASPATCPVDHSSQPSKSWTSTLTSYLPFSSSSTSATPPATTTTASTTGSNSGLGTDRSISTIPRSSSNPDSPACPVDHGSSANAENDSERHASGNWVYPSEKMFFEAMKRKGYEARVADMKTVVPIHNAVNERAWEEIKKWEGPYLEGTTCGGPKLASFANKQQNMTPTARFNTIIGYAAPFDRHDWVIDRCGTRVDYVIDFYSGRPGGAAAGQGPSFYLDVRPKLNTLEGWKMRAARWTGWR